MKTSRGRQFLWGIHLGAAALLGGVLTGSVGPKPHGITQAKQEQPKPPWNTIGALATAPDSKTAVTLSDDGSVDIWDLTRPQKDRKFPEPLRHFPKVVWKHPLGALTFSPDGKRFYVGSTIHGILEVTV